MTTDYAAAYTVMHDKGDGKLFRGDSRPGRGVNNPIVTELVELIKPDRLLDYGSGKAYQYIVDRVHETWGGLLPFCYDVGVRHLNVRPEGTFAGILCAGVMEHIEGDDVDAVLEDIFSFSPPSGHAFVFFFISCVPAKSKKLPDGRNVHLTCEPPSWWEARLARFQRPGLVIRTTYDTGGKVMV